MVRIVAIRGGEKKLFFASQRRNCPLTSHFVDVDEIYHSLFFLPILPSEILLYASFRESMNIGRFIDSSFPVKILL